MRYTIKLHINDTEKMLTAGEGADLFRLLQNSGVVMNTPCAGKGTCGKCAVRVEGDLKTPSDREKSLLGAGKLEKGYRLACYTHVSSDLDVYAEGDMRDASIITAGKMRSISPEPIVQKRYIELEPPSLEDQRPDLERLLEALGSNPERMLETLGSNPEEMLGTLGLHTESDADKTGKALSDVAGCLGLFAIPDNLELMKELPGILKVSGYKITAVLTNGSLAAVEPGDTTDRIFGMAVDIGTTTVAAYLYDLASGKRVSTGSALNPQRKYGADVISRIDHTIRSENGRAELQSLITECIGGLAAEMAASAGISKDDIYTAVFAGNTTMLHLLLGLDAAGVAAVPFIPVTTGPIWLSSKEIGLPFNRCGKVVVFPGVSAYIGGDIVAALLSSGIYEEDGISLLVDIGTNGEIVLGGREWLLACSTAAGPAFEGANIRNGMGGVTGAIDSVGPAPDFTCSVIGNVKPAGICGSGIVDAIAALLDAGLLDETGRMLDADEAASAGEASQRLIDVDGCRAFVLCGGVVQTDETVQNSGIIGADGSIQTVRSVQASGSIQTDGSIQTGESAQTVRSVQTDETVQNSRIIGASGSIQTDGSVHNGIADSGDPTVITQRDVREIQNAKAAIAAGIETLIREAGISPDDIRKVYLAGGFGSSLHIDTAIRIGLLPKTFENRIEAIGNASGAGAAEGLLSAASLRTAEILSRRVRYVELSASVYFTEKYVENMMF